MSDEPEAIEPTAPWKMPEPVFRTTEGVTPKTARRHVDPAPDDDMHLHDTLINEEPSAGSDDQIPPAAPVKAAAANRGWVRGSVYVAVLMGLIAAATLAAAYYYYFIMPRQ